MILTVGHGALAADELGLLLTDAGVEVLIDVRRRPGSRRHPQFARRELEHLTRSGPAEPHRRSAAARVEGGRLVYDLGTTGSLY